MPVRVGLDHSSTLPPVYDGTKLRFEQRSLSLGQMGNSKPRESTENDQARRLWPCEVRFVAATCAVCSVKSASSEVTESHKTAKLGRDTGCVPETVRERQERRQAI